MALMPSDTLGTVSQIKLEEAIRDWFEKRSERLFVNFTKGEEHLKQCLEELDIYLADVQRGLKFGSEPTTSTVWIADEILSLNGWSLDIVSPM